MYIRYIGMHSFYSQVFHTVLTGMFVMVLDILQKLEEAVGWNKTCQPLTRSESGAMVEVVDG